MDSHKKYFPGKSAGFSLIEIVVAVGIAIFFFATIISLTSNTRVSITKATNYLRALELAQETIELLQSSPMGDLMQNKIQIFAGSLVDPHTKKSIPIPMHSDSPWKPKLLSYPEQYDSAWFYRKVKIEPVAASYLNSRFIKKASVDIYWNESKTPTSIETLGAEPDRMRKLSLSTLLFDEKEAY